MDKIGELLEQLATQLGVTADYLWPLLVKQTVCDWWGGFIVSTILLCTLLPVSIKCWKLAAEGRRGEEAFAIFGVFTAIGVGVSLVFFLDHICNISHAITPEAATVERLLELL